MKKFPRKVRLSLHAETIRVLKDYEFSRAAGAVTGLACDGCAPTDSMGSTMCVTHTSCTCTNYASCPFCG